MQRRVKVLLVGAALVAAAVYPTIARAGNSGGEEPDRNEVERPITGPDLERASRIARDHLGGGVVTGTEVGDEDSYYEVEVTLEGGQQVDVQLDDHFVVVGSEADLEDD